LVIGIIAIVFGACAALAGLWGMVSPLLVGAMYDAMPPGVNTAQMKVAQEWTAYTVPLAGLTTLAAVLLLIAGVGLTMRKAWSPRLCISWAVLKMLIVLVNAGLGVVMMREVFSAMEDDPAMAGVPAGLMGGVAIGASAVGVIWGWALPVFMLIWFSRRKIKGQVAEWRSAAPTAFDNPPPPYGT
jgi:hypothetical protein